MWQDASIQDRLYVIISCRPSPLKQKTMKSIQVFLISLMLCACNSANSVEQQKGAAPTASKNTDTTPVTDVTTAKTEEAKPIPTSGETLAELEKSEQSLVVADDLPVRVNRVALTYASQGNFKDAEVLLKRMVGLLEKPQVKATMQLAVSLNNLGLLYMQEKKYGKAEPLFQKSLVLQQSQLGQSDPTFAGSINNLATLYYEQMRYKDALPLFTRAMEIYKLRPVSNALALSKTINNVAGCYSNLKQYDKAEPYLKEALAIEEKLPSNAPGLAAALNNLGYIYEIQGDYEKAEPLLKRGLEIAENVYDSNSMELISFLDNNSYLLRKTNKVAEADKLKARTKQILLANHQ